MACQRPLSSRTCQLCEECPASHCCNCLTPPTRFCMDCFPRHYAKYPHAIHPLTFIAALNYNPQEYMWRVEVLEKGATELRSNLERMEQCSREFDNSIQTCINYLIEYRTLWLQRLESEKAELSITIESAVQEATRCLDQGTEPESGLGRALWSLAPEELQVFSYSVSLPDLQTVCQTWASYENTMQSLCGRVNTAVPRPEEAKNDVPNLFAALFKDAVELYDLRTHKITKHTIPVNFNSGGSYIQVNRHTLFCLGAYPASTAVYGLDLPSLILTSLSPLHAPRCYAGVAKVATTIYVFGGFDDCFNELKCCEKYQDRQWLPLRDMREHRRSFTPCTFRTLIYLPCPQTTLNIETFSPQTETFAVSPSPTLPKRRGMHPQFPSWLMENSVC